jgi:putative salt-induced outer membrane protein YdiY
VAGPLLWLALTGSAAADEVLFRNGDRLSGRILELAGGKLTIKTEVAGEVTVDLAKIKTFSTEEPIGFRLGRATVRSKVMPGADGTVEIAPSPGDAPRVIALKDVTAITRLPVRWSGTVALDGQIRRGNTETTDVGAHVQVERRSEQDRITLEGGYFYGNQTDKDTGRTSTSVDHGFGFGKYDYFVSEKLYLFGAIRAEYDRIADLDLRLTPSAGLGYQWYETPTLQLSSELGLAWVYEDFRHRGDNDHFAARLAYHVKWTPTRHVTLFHNLEYLPALDHPFDDYNLYADAGLRATIVGSLFAELKIQLRYDSVPAPGSDNEDLRYLFGVGWSF